MASHLATVEVEDQTVHMMICPHPRCRGMIPILGGTPAGEYECLCRACRINLWYRESGKPTVELVIANG